LALVALRAIAIVGSGVAAGYYLLVEGHAQDVFGDPLPRYLDWGSVITTFRASTEAVDGLLVTLQLASAGAVIALLAAAVLSLLSRWRPFRDLLRLSIVPLVSLLAPVTALLSYWLTIKLGAAPAAAFEGIGAGLDAAVTNGWLPAVVVAISMLPGLAALLNRKTPALAELGWASGVAQLASRSAPHGQWTLGLPAGTTVLALAVVESIFAPMGLFGRFAAGLNPVDSELLLAILCIVSAAGALLAIPVDLFGRSAPHDDTHEFAGVRTRTDGRMAAFGFAVGVVGLATLLLAALIGGSLDAGIGALADPLSSPFSNGYLLGSDGAGRDLFNLALAATGAVLQRALIPAAIASAIGAGLAAVAHNLPRRAAAIPGTLVDLLWWPAPLFGLLIIAIWGVGDELQLLTSTILVPFAYRLSRREVIGAPVGTGRRFGGVISLVAASAFAIDTALGFIAASSYPIDANWGTQLASSSETITSSIWPALVPSVAIVLFGFVLNLAGSYLVASGWTAWLASPEARRAAAEARDAATATTAASPVPPEEPSTPHEPLSLLPGSDPEADDPEAGDPETTANPEAGDPETTANPEADDPAVAPNARNDSFDRAPRSVPHENGSIRPPAFPGTADNPLDRPMRQPIVAATPDRLLSPPPLVPGAVTAATTDTPLPPPEPVMTPQPPVD